MTRFISGLLLGCLGAAASACGGSSTPTTPTDTTPPPTAVAETFSGTVAVGGQSFHAFTVAASNYDVAVLLNSAGPPATIFMIVSIGNVSGNLCVPLNNASVLAQGGTTAQLTGTINAGSYCVSVADAGNQVQDVVYSVTVSHF